MSATFDNVRYDSSKPLSIFKYSESLIGHTLREVVGEDAVKKVKGGKGRLGQMVEELFFQYQVNSDRNADFKEAGVELKCTPLLKSADGETHRIKERLVCSMIDYHELAKTPFEKSHLLLKCRLMLLLFYLHVSGIEVYDYKFLYRVLWQLPEKDLLLIEKDYDTIAEKVRRGEAHLISEGDTLYLGACRKGQKGDALQAQPFSDIKAKKRAFSLKPAYMRYVLTHVENSGCDYYTNYQEDKDAKRELVSIDELQTASFEQIIVRRFAPFIGKNYSEICEALCFEAYQSKSKYADVASLIASNLQSKRLSTTEEFKKSGIILKTVRLSSSGMPKESMSFKNIDYMEVFENDDWVESEAYEIFTSRFMFVVFKPEVGKQITIHNNRTDAYETEQSYVLDSVFFWTMPQADLDVAHEYWENIRSNVLSDNIRADAFWSIGDHRIFHVRPKATKKIQKTANPFGGMSDKFCYWLNADYVKTVIENNAGNEKV